jgi:branched-chain amino acid transport system ATP-binding protein
MLAVENVMAEYSGMTALHGVSIEVKDGEFVSVIGSNGAGKTTLLKAISGTVKSRRGQILFMGLDITGLQAHKRTELGIVHVPEGRRIFPSLTVAENLELGAYRKAARPKAAINFELVFDIFPVLRQRQDQLGCTLSGGEQQMLAIGRGIMAEPRLLMLDEPSLGLSPLMADNIFETIKDIRAKLRLAVLLVEQRAVEALELCDRGYCLDCGKVILCSDGENLVRNPLVQKAYLGHG